MRRRSFSIRPPSCKHASGVTVGVRVGISDGDGVGDGENAGEEDGENTGAREGAARVAANVGGAVLAVAGLPCAAPDAVQALQASRDRSITNNIQPGFMHTPFWDRAPV